MHGWFFFLELVLYLHSLGKRLNPIVGSIDGLSVHAKAFKTKTSNGQIEPFPLLRVSIAHVYL